MAPRKRDYQAEYARRQARAREAGFSGYYEQRTRPAPGAPKPPPEQLAQLRGHRGFADLVRSLGPGDIVGVDPYASHRDQFGQWDEVSVVVIDGDDGGERFYTLRDMEDWEWQLLMDEMEDADAIDSPSYSIKAMAPA